MGTSVILPTTYTTDGSSFYVRDPSYMYTDISSTTHAEISSYSYDKKAHYVYLKGFDLSSAVPAGMQVDSVTVQANVEFQNGLNTSTGSYPALCNGTTVVANASVSGNIYTFSGLDWNTISGYGDDLSIRLCHRKKNAYSSVALYVYGAQVNVEYSESGGSDAIYIKQNGVWTEAAAVYKKIGGVWTEQTDLANVFDAGVNYVSE